MMDGKKVYGPYEAMTLGIELENAGYGFYSRMAGAAVDYRIKNMFDYLAEAEMEHKRFIKEEIEPLFTPEWYREEDRQMMSDYLRNVQKQPVFPDASEAEKLAAGAMDAQRAIDIGIRAEERSMDYFAFLRDATRDRQGRDAFHHLHLEETKHLELLQDIVKSHY